MSAFSESLKRLYAAGRVTKEQIAERVRKGTVSAADYEEITGGELPDAAGGEKDEG